MKNETIGYIPVDETLKEMFDAFVDAYISTSGYAINTDGPDFSGLSTKALILAINASIVYSRGFFEKKEKK